MTVSGDADINKSSAKKHKILNESGAPLSKRYKTTKYEQWSQRTKRAIPQVGEQESRKPMRERFSKFKKFQSAHPLLQHTESETRTHGEMLCGSG